MISFQEDISLKVLRVTEEDYMGLSCGPEHRLVNPVIQLTYLPNVLNIKGYK
jgi:hypothetical protein